MNQKQPRNILASIKGRLLQLSKQQREDFNYLLTRYAAERFLSETLYLSCVPTLKPQESAQNLATGAKLGLDPTPDTIREGSVRMEQHPNYKNLMAEIQRLEFAVKNTQQDEPHVVVREVFNPDIQLIRVEKILYIQEGMRYLDLEHELGHIQQLCERFGEKLLPTERMIEYPDGRIKDISERGGVLTNWQNTITEYYNRLVEFIKNL
jgi:hypothetical protein